jgi:hypothetical protein
MIAINAINCASATTITLDIMGTPDMCTGAEDSLQLTEVGVAVTDKNKVNDPAQSPLTQYQQGCHDSKSGDVGTIVISPQDSDHRNSTIGVRVVAGFNGKHASDCDDANDNVAKNCIITHRNIVFTAGANVPYQIILDPKCANVTYARGTECVSDDVTGQPTCRPTDVISQQPDPGKTTDKDSGDTTPIDANVPIEDSGVKDAGGPDGNACNECSGPGRSCDSPKQTCTIDCAAGGANCTNSNVCLNGKLSYDIRCNGNNVCLNTSCLGIPKSGSFDCSGGNGGVQCNNIACDAGEACNVKCAVTTDTCNVVTLAGKTNTMDCKKTATDTPSCDNVSCIPGQTGGTKCTRTCDNDAGCGPTFTCDAGDCTAFEGSDGGTGL